jgi:hypothetical protein
MEYTRTAAAVAPVGGNHTVTVCHQNLSMFWGLYRGSREVLPIELVAVDQHKPFAGSVARTGIAGSADQIHVAGSVQSLSLGA